MSRIVLVGQEVGGVGKSTLIRSLATMIPDAAVVELESVPRLIDLGDRVVHFPVRADRAEIEATGGEAAQAEFDAIADHLIGETRPTLVDIGANASKAIFGHLQPLAKSFARAEREVALVTVVVNDAAAIAEAWQIRALAADWVVRTFIVENRLRGPVDPVDLEKLTEGTTVTSFRSHALATEAKKLLQSLGLAAASRLDEEALEREYGPSSALRILRQIASFRADAMDAVKHAAAWVIE